MDYIIKKKSELKILAKPSLNIDFHHNLTTEWEDFKEFRDVVKEWKNCSIYLRVKHNHEVPHLNFIGKPVSSVMESPHEKLHFFIQPAGEYAIFTVSLNNITPSDVYRSLIQTLKKEGLDKDPNKFIVEFYNEKSFIEQGIFDVYVPIIEL